MVLIRTVKQRQQALHAEKVANGAYLLRLLNLLRFSCFLSHRKSQLKSPLREPKAGHDMLTYVIHIDDLLSQRLLCNAKISALGTEEQSAAYV